jgi:general secretion pathway protein B
MSLILDAIKKSERERQQQEVPSLASDHEDYQSNKPRRNHWPKIIGLLILIASIIYYVYPQQQIIEKVEVITNTDNKNIPKQVQQSIIEPKIEQQKLTVSKKMTPTKVPVNTKKSAAVILNATELDSELRNSLPEINFSSHVFTGNSATSFVVLNDELLGVGEWFNEDIKIIQINKDGMVIVFEDQQIFVKALEKINP